MFKSIVTFIKRNIWPRNKILVKEYQNIYDYNYSIFKVADWFVAMSNENGDKHFTHLKLQKLCYFSQVFFLAYHGRPLFHEDFCHWVSGPACPELYEKYKKYSYLQIKSDSPAPIFSGEELGLLKETLHVFGKYTGPELEHLASKGVTCNQTEERSVIKKELLMREFRQAIQRMKYGISPEFA